MAALGDRQTVKHNGLPWGLSLSETVKHNERWPNSWRLQTALPGGLLVKHKVGFLLGTVVMWCQEKRV